MKPVRWCELHVALNLDMSGQSDLVTRQSAVILRRGGCPLLRSADKV